jgi:hypothetical protein
MINLKNYLGKKVYIELEKKTDDLDPEEEDKTQGGSIFKTLDEVMESASEDDEFIEIEITRQFKTKNKCLKIEEIKVKKTNK